MDLRQSPRAVDGTPFTAPCLFPAGVYLYIAGAGDDAVQGRGEGQLFNASRDTAGETTIEWQFNDLVYMAGGGALFADAVLGDWASLWVTAPATAVTPNGGGTGNCNVVNGVIVPAAGDGAYDVDLSTAVPVPAQTAEGYNGYWEWDWPITGKGTISVGTPGEAHFHLIAAEVPLVRYAAKLPLLGTSDLDLTLPAVEPKVQLPQWKGQLKLHNEDGNHTVKIGWFLMTARAVTL
jgi:hypothetical protein